MPFDSATAVLDEPPASRPPGGFDPATAKFVVPEKPPSPGGFDPATAKFVVPEKPLPTIGERVVAGTSGVYSGIAGLLGAPMDLAELAMQLGGSKAPPIRADIGAPGTSESIRKVMEAAGLRTENPRPDDFVSRMLHTGGEVAGGSLVPGARPISTVAAALGAATAGEAFGGEWAGIGALGPSIAVTGAAAAKDRIASTLAPRIASYTAIGTSPSLGQATGNTFLQGLENVVAKIPGGTGVMKRFREGQQEVIGAVARTGVSGEAAGRAIERGITGEGGFLARTKAQWQQLDAALSAKVPPATALAPASTMAALDDLTAAIPGAQAASATLVNPKLAQLRMALTDDLEAAGGQVPFEALRALRTKVGSMLDDTLVSGVPGGELKKVYAAMTRDMEAAARAAGAGKEFARQNRYWAARMDRVESVLERVIGKGKQPEDIFKTFFPTDVAQAGKVRAVMRSLEPAERRVVSEAVVNRLGRAAPGQQTDVGDVFSTETFLTNWNKLSPGAKAQLFSDPKMVSDMDHIAKIASDMRKAGGVFSNASGTAGLAAAQVMAVGPIASLATMDPTFLLATASMAASANVTARLLTSPKFVDWLATASKTRPENLAVHMGRLAALHAEGDPDEKAELEKFVGGMSARASRGQVTDALASQPERR